MMRIGLLPLDERPVNTRYVAMIAAIAGVEVLMPPTELLPKIRQPARAPALAAWLHDVAAGLDALIVSCELLGYGGLILSRITNDPAGTIIARLDVLRTIKRQHPHLVMYGFNVITRVSNANSAFEEPTYWAEWGARMYRLSQVLDQDVQGQPAADVLAALRADIPTVHVQDFLGRRVRNHTVNLAVLQLLRDNVLDLLVLSSDDTSPYGLPSREKRWLSTWAAQLGLGERLLMYPGADEVGSTLLARLVNQAHGVQPSFAVQYAVPDGEWVVAPYEDGPVHVTVERHVGAVGGTLAQTGDVWVAVNPPVERRSEWHLIYAEQERHARSPHLETLVEQIRMEQRPVIVADVAYPNGADPVLVNLLAQQVNLTRLAAYGGWNTAGNTIGTALAQGCAAQFMHTDEQRTAHERFLLHRFVEDWGYQHLVRAEVRDWLRHTTDHDEPTAANVAATSAWIERRLQRLIADLPGFTGRYRIVPGSVRLPWNRTFEVDFDIEAIPARD
jgi:hypothetical protein